jgi:hypothetical protein
MQDLAEQNQTNVQLSETNFIFLTHVSLHMTEYFLADQLTLGYSYA